jgi:hypothetical protein
MNSGTVLVFIITLEITSPGALVCEIKIDLKKKKVDK